MTSLPHKEPKALTAHEILFGSREAYRRDQDKDTNTVGTRQTYLRRANPRRPEQVDEAIVELLRRAVVDEGCESLMIRREGIAAWIKVPEHSVSQSLERLNKQGLVGPEENHAPHENNRHGWGGSESGWCGSIRYARTDRLRSLFEVEAPAPTKSTKSPRPR